MEMIRLLHEEEKVYAPRYEYKFWLAAMHACSRCCDIRREARRGVEIVGIGRTKKSTLSSPEAIEKKHMKKIEMKRWIEDASRKALEYGAEAVAWLSVLEGRRGALVLEISEKMEQLEAEERILRDIVS